MAGENDVNNSGDAHQKGAEDRKIFVGGIAAEVTNDDLLQYFSQFGDVTQAQVKIDRTTGRSRGFAFVEFGTADSCKTALNKREQTIKGKPCEVKPAKSRENKKVFVGGLPAEHPEGELRSYFEQFGKVDDVEWPFDKQTKQRRNFAFIVFEEEDAADRAASQPKHMFSDRECDVKKAVPQNRRFQNRGFQGAMGTGMRGGYGGGGMRPQMTHGGTAPWYGGGWNQMAAGVYGTPGQGNPAGSGWGDWYSGAGYYQSQQNPAAYSGYGAGGYDYTQNGSSAAGRGQGGQNGSVGQRTTGGYQQSQY